MATWFPQWRVVFMIGTRQAEQVVGASDAWQAGEILKKQYSGQRVVIMHVERA